MVLPDELKDLSSADLDDKWTRPFSSWASRSSEFGRGHGTSASVGNSGIQSLRSYLSQIKKGMEHCDFQSEQSTNAEDATTCATDVCPTRKTDKYERVKRLESSLYGIQSNVELKRSNMLEEIYQRINSLESRISDGEVEQRKAYNEANKAIDTIERSITAAKAKHDLELKDTILKLEDIYKRFNDSLQKEKEQWKKVESCAIDDINNQVKTIRDELEDMKKAKTHVDTYLKKYIDVELPQLKKKISSATEDIRNMEKTIISNTNEDLVMLATFIKQEASHINDLKRAVLNEVAKTGEATKAQLAKETEERKHMQQRMVALMEETLKRLGSPL